MRGGVKIYRGDAGGARTYVEADRSRADDYYLTEGTGTAQRFVTHADGRVWELPGMEGDRYEAWVAGVDPDTGEARGRLRFDDRAVRFAEVVVNGPKTWSIAAELHPDLATAYEQAQDQAVTAIIAWVGEHATARVGPRGQQVAVPVERLDAVAVRHYTTRAGDPHRHVHLQINARVQAAGSWRGIDTVAVRDSIAAMNGIGHAAVMTNPQFRATLARFGFTLNSDGEIEQLTRYVAPFSRRAAQITVNVDRYEIEWRAAHPGQEPGPALRRAWDTRAWAESRPDKNHAEPGHVAHKRWIDELDRLGWTPSTEPVVLPVTPIARVDRDAAAAEVLTRLGAARSAWNQADLRGETELLIARANVVAEPRVRTELAEDITARALAASLPLLDRAGVPEHVRAWTSAYVLEVEADLTARLASRGAHTGRDAPLVIDTLAGSTGRGLDAAQAVAVSALAGDHDLVVVQGAAGAGKTTTLAAARDQLNAQGHALVVVTPTLKAAKVAAAELGAATGSAAWLAYQHGWRWDDTGTWTRLSPGDTDPTTGHTYLGPKSTARLRAGDLLVVDEAGMLDQDTARAVLTIADGRRLRVALVGDPHQLTAVGRGGVLDLAERWTSRQVALDVIHRFTRAETAETGTTVTVPDVEYADLTLAMRSGDDPGAVFDRLVSRGQVVVHETDDDRTAVLAERAVASLDSETLDGARSGAVMADTREQVRDLNQAIRARRVTAGRVDDARTVNTGPAETIGGGDVIATRRNDTDAGVANRDTWTVTAITPDGGLKVTGPAGDRTLAMKYVAEHVELAYATTAHGVQGDTTDVSDLALSEHTTAASAYVAMTRGRESNTVHIVAGSLDQARDQWIAAAGRDRADLGLERARDTAREAAALYAEPRPLDDVLAELRAAWSEIADGEEDLAWARPRLEQSLAAQAQEAAYEAARTPLDRRIDTSYQREHHLTNQLRAAKQRADQTATAIRDSLLTRWNADRPVAEEATRVIAAGPGRFGRHRRAVTDAEQQLDAWTDRWEPIIGDQANGHPRIPLLYEVEPALADFVRTQAEIHHPEMAALRDAIAATRADRVAARHEIGTLETHHHVTYPGGRPRGFDPDALERQITNAETHLAEGTLKADRLAREPGLISQPPGVLDTARAEWATDRAAAQAERDAAAIAAAIRRNEQAAAQHRHEPSRHQPRRPAPGHGRAR